jgi:hypothetical protein
MKRPLRAAILAAGAVAALAVANAAFAANTASLAVWHTPMALANSSSTTIHVNVPQTTDPIAAVNIYSGTGYTVNLSQAAGTTIGSVEATAFSRDNNLTLPLSGNVVTSDPTTAANKAGSAQCVGLPQSQAVWIMNLSVAGQTLAIPIYVNDTNGAPDQALGGFRLSICLPPPDVPQGTPGRAFQGAQLLDAVLTLTNVFTTPTGGGLVKWESLFTPYSPGKGTPNKAGTFEARAFVPLPLILGIQVKWKSKKTHTYTLSGKVTEGGAPVANLSLTVLRGTSSKSLPSAGTVTTNGSGGYSRTGKLKPKKTYYFQVQGSTGERDYTATGCANPATLVAPAGCVKATLSKWSAKSVVVKLPK